MFKTILIALVTSTFTSASLFWAFYMGYIPSPKKSSEDAIKDFYITENAVHTSPHSIRKAIQKWNNKAIIVDLRSAEEYNISHIVTAINIPAYKNPDESAYDEVDRIVWAFRKLPKDREIIVYCYSTPCMTGRKIGKMLVEHGIFVKHLGIGWNEWKYSWKSWNHELEWDVTKVEDYISSGTEPGVFSGGTTNPFTPCSADGNTGC